MDPKEKETLNEEQLNTEETTDCTDAPQEEAAATDANQNQGEETPVLSVEEELARQLEEAKATIEEQKDKYLRLSAEFDNYRKRTLREKSDILKYGSEEVLKDLLPVVDDLDRALKAIETATDINAVKDGLTLIVTKFNEFLKSKGVKEIDAVGQELNTDLHEAITKFPVQDEAQKGKIVDVVQKGYMLNDKVMRFSKVVVGE